MLGARGPFQPDFSLTLPWITPVPQVPCQQPAQGHCPLGRSQPQRAALRPGMFCISMSAPAWDVTSSLTPRSGLQGS